MVSFHSVKAVWVGAEVSSLKEYLYVSHLYSRGCVTTFWGSVLCNIFSQATLPFFACFGAQSQFQNLYSCGSMR